MKMKGSHNHKSIKCVFLFLNFFRFLINLAVADLCVGIFVMLPAIYKVNV